MIGGFCLKAWSRLQQAVALSSAESELYGLVEGAKEALSIRRAISHVFGWEDLPKPYIYCDSEAAIAISRADGLRKVRHIDLRACFIQEAPIVLKRSALKEGPLWPKRRALFNLEAP